eukprot:1967800-Pyramimonas_sp.AAC.1
MPLPDGFGRAEAALLARLWHTAHCALPMSGWLNLDQWGGPKFDSLTTSTSAALIRASLETFQSWRTVLPLLRASAEAHLP